MVVLYNHNVYLSFQVPKMSAEGKYSIKRYYYYCNNMFTVEVQTLTTQVAELQEELQHLREEKEREKQKKKNKGNVVST
jgi:vacuolar-type H+-ATPase subunit I/STV1